MVLYAPVIEYVAANLRAPLNLLLASFHLGLFGHTVFHLLVVEHGAQQAEGILTVLGLVARLGVLNQDLLLLAGVGVLVLVA